MTHTGGKGETLAIDRRECPFYVGLELVVPRHSSEEKEMIWVNNPAPRRFCASRGSTGAAILLGVKAGP